MNIKKNGKIIADNAKILKSSFKHALGLMFSKQKNLIFEFRKEMKNPIHMLFVFYPIDLVFLNKNKRVIELKKSLKPFEIYNTKKEAKYLLELKNDTIKKENIKINDKISFSKQ